MKKNNAIKILQLVGGKNNVQGLVHCATRLRFTLKDENKADKSALEDLPDVLKVVQSGGQYQIVIGPEVAEYYDIIIDKIGNKKSADTEGKITLTKVISGAFTPIIPILAGAGMVKAFITLGNTLSWFTASSTFSRVLSAAGNSIFYFLPIFLGITLSKQLKADPFVGGALGAALLEPNFTRLIGKKGLEILGVSLQPVNYSFTVFPIFIMIAVYALMDRGLKKIIPKSLQLFLNPMICLVTLFPLTVIVFGPWGNNVGNAISQFIMWLFKVNGALAGFVLGGIYPFLVVLGLHWGLDPISLQNMHLYGGDVIEGAGGVTQYYAALGVAVGAFLRAKKNSKMREIAAPTIVTALFAGVTEPIIYGIALRSKRTMVTVAIGGAVGGLFNGLFGVKLTQYVFYNVFGLALQPLNPFLIGITGMMISLGVSAVLTYFFGKDAGDEMYETQIQAKTSISNQSTDHSEKKVPTIIVSPLAGKVIDLKDVEDEVFSSGSVGKGLAIEPTEGIVKSPFNGKVITIFPSKHAIGLVSDQGAEVLIHLGLDTVNLNGNYFELKVSDGEKIAQGQLLIKFDYQKIKQAGYKMQSPVLWTNYSENGYRINVKSGQTVSFSDQIMEVNE